VESGVKILHIGGKLSTRQWAHGNKIVKQFLANQRNVMDFLRPAATAQLIFDATESQVGQKHNMSTKVFLSDFEYFLRRAVSLHCGRFWYHQR